MRISDWSSDVCSSDLGHHWRLASATDADGARIDALFPGDDRVLMLGFADGRVSVSGGCNGQGASYAVGDGGKLEVGQMMSTQMACDAPLMDADAAIAALLAQPQEVRFRSEEHTSELQSLMRISYAV